MLNLRYPHTQGWIKIAKQTQKGTAVVIRYENRQVCRERLDPSAKRVRVLHNQPYARTQSDALFLIDFYYYAPPAPGLFLRGTRAFWLLVRMQPNTKNKRKKKRALVFITVRTVVDILNLVAQFVNSKNKGASPGRTKLKASCD